MLFSQYEACISFSEKTMKKRYSQIVYPQKLKTPNFYSTLFDISFYFYNSERWEKGIQII